VAIHYGVIICVFMAGTLWGHSLQLKGSHHLFGLVASNVATLLIFFGVTYFNDQSVILRAITESSAR